MQKSKGLTLTTGGHSFGMTSVSPFKRNSLHWAIFKLLLFFCCCCLHSFGWVGTSRQSHQMFCPTEFVVNEWAVDHKISRNL
ncbi:hypothetical protein niasHT_007931 [Heterodera trifolii]|uniref:Uncharacterized protein n=1 Tax=Heterodera trifolii TaxID=157864 RepID=A0ABD2M2I2_9BILA